MFTGREAGSVRREGWLSPRKQVNAFWVQARADYSTALTLMDAGIYYAAVFFCQQAGEKALKAATISSKHTNPRSHHLIQIANSLDAPIEVMNAAAELNADFVTARNPDANEGIPAYSYDRKSAEAHLRAAEVIIEWVSGIVG